MHIHSRTHKIHRVLYKYVHGDRFDAGHGKKDYQFFVSSIRIENFGAAFDAIFIKVSFSLIAKFQNETFNCYTIVFPCYFNNYHGSVISDES